MRSLVIVVRLSTPLACVRLNNDRKQILMSEKTKTTRSVVLPSGHRNNEQCILS